MLKNYQKAIIHKINNFIKNYKKKYIYFIN